MADTTTATKNSASKTEPKFKFGELVQWQPIGGDEWYHGVITKAEWQEKEYSYTIYHHRYFLTELETQRGSTDDDAYYHIVTESMVTLKKESVSEYIGLGLGLGYPPREDWPDSESEADEDTSVTIEPKAKPAGSKRKATGTGQVEQKKVKTHKYKQDDRSRKWHCTPKVKVLDPKKEFDKYGAHCLNEKYYVKAVSGKAIEVIDVSDKDERLQTFSLAVDKGVITDVALSGTALLVGISCHGDFEATHDVKLYDLTYRYNPHIIWKQQEQRKWQFGPVLDFGFCSYPAEPYILCKKKLVFPVLSHSFDFGDLEAGPEVLIAPDKLKLYNLKKGETYYTGAFVDIEIYPFVCSEKEQVGAYACIDKYGRYAVLSSPDRGRYFIRDLQTERNIGYIGFAPTFIAKNEDGFFVLCDTGDCYQMIGKKNYYSTHVRMKGVDHMAVYNYGDRVKCMKMLEDGKLQTFSA